MEDRDYLILLYDYYGELFNDKQRNYFESYYFDNLSLSEIGDNYNISRNAVYKVLKNMSSKLYFYEEKLKLYSKFIKFNDIISNIDDIELKNKLGGIF